MNSAFKFPRLQSSCLPDAAANARIHGKIEGGNARARSLCFGFFSCALIACFALCNGCQTAPPSQVAERGGTSTTVYLTQGDVVKLLFPGSPELNQSQKVQTDGKINLPMIGQVQAAGRSIASLQAELSARYKSQLQNTEVVVSLDSSIIPVVISGAVTTPGKREFDRPTTVFQAIMEAGGANQFGNLKNVHLIRTINGQQVTSTLNLQPTLEGRTTNAVYVKNGDIIYVPESMF
jgi:polysaccharide export outer membrane protein